MARARAYQSTLSPRRRWAIASCAAMTALVLTAGLGNPWTFGTLGSLATRSGFSQAQVLASTPRVFAWSLTAQGFSANTSMSFWISGIVLDLGWPLLLLIGARLLAGGLAMRRARLSLVVGVWSLAALTAAVAGLIAGLVYHSAGAHYTRGLDVMLAHPAGPVDQLTIQAATLGLVGAALGWLPGIVAAFAYSTRRATAKEAATTTASLTGTEPTAVIPASRSGASAPEPTKTLDLAGLERLRSARRRGDFGSALPDAGTSTFFNE